MENSQSRKEEPELRDRRPNHSGQDHTGSKESAQAKPVDSDILRRVLAVEETEICDRDRDGAAALDVEDGAVVVGGF